MKITMDKIKKELESAQSVNIEQQRRTDGSLLSKKHTNLIYENSLRNYGTKAKEQVPILIKGPRGSVKASSRSTGRKLIKRCSTKFK